MRSIPSTDPADDRRGSRTGEVEAVLDLLFRRRAGQLTATLTRILGIDQLDLVEDVVQDAFVQALKRWPSHGIPDNPSAWIVRVAKNRAVDVLRRQGRWRDKRSELQQAIMPESGGDGGPLLFSTEVADDELRMIFAACHPSIPRDAQVALTLKTVGGFGVEEIARAFLVSKQTMAQRIVRAKRTLREAGAELGIPAGSDLRGPLDSVLEVLYLMFNEGYASAGEGALVRQELCGEAIRLVELLAGHPAVAEPRIDALAALFLFQASRLPARTTITDEIASLSEQDRRRWDRPMMRRALLFMTRSAQGDEVTPYHLQAEIAAHHSLASTYEETPWTKILACYNELAQTAPSPIVSLNRAVALGMVEGASIGLREVQAVKAGGSLDSYHYLYAIEAEMLARLGRFTEAEAAVATAISLVDSLPMQLLLARRANDYSRRS